MMIERPNKNQTWDELWAERYTHLRLFGLSYQWLVRDPIGRVIEVHNLHPARVTVCADRVGLTHYHDIARNVKLTASDVQVSRKGRHD